MIELTGVIVNRIPSLPPFRRADSGKLYLRRMTDGAILLDGDEFMFFDTRGEAQEAASEFEFPIEIRRVP